MQHHATAPWFSAQLIERNNHVLKWLVLKDTINILTDISLVNMYKFPWITCHLGNYSSECLGKFYCFIFCRLANGYEIPSQLLV